MRKQGTFRIISLISFMIVQSACNQNSEPVQESIITIAGGPDFSGDGGPATQARMLSPNGVFVAPDGTVYFTDTGQSAIRKMNPDGTIETVGGSGEPGYSGDGGPATQARMSYPNGLLMDGDGNLFIGEEGSHVIRKIDPQRMISTFAGTGKAGFSGDGGPATQAELRFPRRLALAPDGALYFSDGNNHRVRKITPDGIITTIAGTGDMGYAGDGGPATAAQLNIPRDVALDNQGNLFVLDSVNFRVRKIDKNGIISTIAGLGIPGFEGDGGPAVKARIGLGFGLDSDSAGNLYLTDVLNARIRRIGTDGIINTVAGNGPGSFFGDGGPATQAHISVIGGLDVLDDGTLYIADSGNHRIRRVDSDGVINTVAGNGDLGHNGPALKAGMFSSSVTADNQGNVYISERGNFIHRLDPTGTLTPIAGTHTGGYSGDDGPADRAQVFWPSGMYRTEEGLLYFADSRNNRIRMIDTLGIITTIGGTGALGYAGDDIPATEATMTQPGAVWKTEAALLIMDTGNHRIRSINGDGVITTIAGTGIPGYRGDDGLATEAELNTPMSIYVNNNGEVFFTEIGNFRVRKISTDGIITTIAGNGLEEDSGDGGPATQASIALPLGIHGNDNGYLYIASASRIRVVHPDGRISSLTGEDGTYYTGDNLFIDDSGDLLISDGINFRVRKIIGAYTGR